MSEEKKWERRQKRAKTHFKFYSEDYLIGGSTRAELLPDERNVWLDFLCLASLNFGKVEIFSRDMLAAQLLISRELLDRSIEKFLKHGKVTKKYNKKEKKEIFYIVKWLLFQADYLTKRLKKTSKNERSEECKKDDAELTPTLDEMRSDDIKLHEMRENESHQKSQNVKLPNSHLNSSSFSLGEDFNERKREFLTLLRDCKNYPFNEANDTMLFEIAAIKHSHIDIIYQLKKKIEWWKKKSSPTAVKCKPRTQLLDHFEKAFKKKEGPEKVGDIAERFVLTQERKDQIEWLEREIKRKETR